MNNPLNILDDTVDMKFHMISYHNNLSQNTINMTNPRAIYVLYLSTFMAKLFDIIFTNLNPSSGGSGIILKTANAILIIENFKKNQIKNP